ncbi:MAG: helix-turn-helix transcriptional regulator [Candidatus Elarobacter sp.]
MLAARRRSPSVYVIDGDGEIVLRGASMSSISDDGHQVARRLLAAARDEDEMQLGLSQADGVLRVVPLVGAAGAHCVLFVERIAQRDPLAAAVVRYNLTARERDVLELLLRGASTSEMASELAIAETTIITHIRNIGCKTNATKRREIVATVLASA